MSEHNESKEAEQTEWEPKLFLTIAPGSNGVSLMSWNGNNRLAVVGRERTVFIHDFDVTLNSRINVDFETSEIRFAKQDLLIAAGLSGGVTMFKLRKELGRNVNIVQSQRHLLAHNAPVFALNVDPLGATFVSAGADKVVKLWTVSGQKLLGQFRKHTNAVRHLAYKADGSGFVSAGDDRDILEWDCRSPNPIGSITNHCGGGASALTYLPEGHLVVGHRDSNLRVFEARTKTVLATYRVYDHPIRCLSMHQSGQFVATSSVEDQCVSLIDLLNGAPLTTFTVKIAVKQTVFLSPSNPPVNDFDTSDLLCVPCQGRKLNIFNCDLTRLVVEEIPPESPVETNDIKTDAKILSEEIIRQLDPNLCPVKDKPRSPPPLNAVPSNQKKISGEEMMAQRVKRMSVMRRSIHPKKIIMDDITEEQEPSMDLDRTRNETENVKMELNKIIENSNKNDPQVADLIQRVERLERKVTDGFTRMEQRLSALEGKKLKAIPYGK